MVMWYKNTLNLVYIISFVDLFAIGLTVPLFGNYLRNLGSSYVSIGLITSTYSGLQVVSGPIIGGWSDVRDRKSVLQTVLFICAVCYGLLGLTNSLFVIFILRFILGCTKHIQSICKAVISDLVTVEEQTEAFGKSAGFGSFGFIFGPFVGGHLAELTNGWSYVCCITMLLFLINISVSTQLPVLNKKRMYDEDHVDITKQVKREFSKIFADFHKYNWKMQWETILLRFLFGMTIATYFSNQGLYLKAKYELSERYIGYIVSFFSTIGMTSAFLLKYINRFYKDDTNCLQRLYHFFSLLAFCIIAIYISPSLQVFLILLIPFSVSCTILRIVSMELMFKNESETGKGSLSGASNSIMSVARFVSPLLTGIIGDFLGEQSTILVAVIPALLGILISLHLQR